MRSSLARRATRPLAAGHHGRLKPTSLAAFAALEPAAYGVNGVPEEMQPTLLDELRRLQIGAECAAELEPRAVAEWERLAGERGSAAAERLERADLE